MHSKNMDQFCTFHQAPSHTIHNCNAVSVITPPSETAHVVSSTSSNSIINPHTLISPLQLEDNSMDLQWCRGYGIEFYQVTLLSLWHITLPIYLDLVDSVAVAQMPSAGMPAAMLAVDQDLIHCRLGHTCEAMSHTHVEHSEVYSDAQKARLCSSHLSQLYRVCALGKQVALTHQKEPNPPEERAERPGKIISTDLLTVEAPSIGGARYVQAVTDMSTRYHWTAPLRLKSDATDKLCHIILSMLEPLT